MKGRSLDSASALEMGWKIYFSLTLFVRVMSSCARRLGATELLLHQNPVMINRFRGARRSLVVIGCVLLRCNGETAFLFWKRRFIFIQRNTVLTIFASASQYEKVSSALCDELPHVRNIKKLRSCFLLWHPKNVFHVRPTNEIKKNHAAV